MTHTTVTVSEDTTLGEEHSGVRLVVDAVATITLPHEDTYKHMKGDENEIISGTSGNVRIEGEEGVTILPLSSALITKKGAYVKTEYQGNNTYLMWGVVSILIMISAMLYTQDYTPVEQGVILINYAN